MLVDATDEELLAFHRGIYQDAFAAQHEPVDIWQRARRDELGYELRVRIAVEDRTIVGGIAVERYPRSNCGLLTYVVVAPHARGKGLGRALIDDARALFDVAAVFGEVNDPRTQTREPREVAEARLARFVRWGARVVDVRYVQPSLGPGLPRDETLLLIAFDDRDGLDGAIVRAFVEELYAVTEGTSPVFDIPPIVPLRR